MTTTGPVKAVLLLLVATGCLLSGCERPAEESTAITLETIAPGDECHVCGMMITGFPGPKAQAFVRNRERPFLFCSTVDLFAWWLQPENRSMVRAAYVHDMGATEWHQPSDDAFVPAEGSWYVAGHGLPGAMGPALASFRDRGEAEAFADRHGGRLLAFESVNLDVLADLAASAFPGDMHSDDH